MFLDKNLVICYNLYIIIIIHYHFSEKVVKTRLQLQGELAKSGTYTKSYRGVFHAIIQIGRHDGVQGLQKGLVPAFGFQFVLNALR